MRTVILGARRTFSRTAPARPEPVEVILNGRAIIALLTLASLALVLASYAQDVLGLAFPSAGLPRIWRLDLDVEASLPTWFSSGLILLNGLLLGLIARAAFRQQSPWAWHWLVLALVFVGLSIDEALSLHEALSKPVRRMLGAGGLLYFAWVVPLILACLVGAIGYLPFMLAQSSAQRRRLLSAAGLFLAGAIGVEMIGGAVVEAEGVGTFAYRTLVTLEEALEMIGMLAFLNFLLHEIGCTVRSCRLHIG